VEDEFTSGPWTGFYIYSNGRRERMDLSLSFREGRLSGVGRDPVGDFTSQRERDQAATMQRILGRKPKNLDLFIKRSSRPLPETSARRAAAQSCRDILMSGGRMVAALTPRQTTSCGRFSPGTFTSQGGYDPERGDVYWTKTYPGRHDIFYKSIRDARGIWGTGQIRDFSTGGFHIRPEGQGEGAAASAAAEIDAPVGVSEPTLGPEAETPRKVICP
jgi:hypothetical protein